MMFKVIGIIAGLLVIISFTLNTSDAISIKNIASSTFDTAKGVAAKIPDVIPSPESIFASSKNIIAGYPFEVAFKAISSACAASVSSDTVKSRVSPDLKKMNFLLIKSKVENYTIPMETPELLWNHNKFNRNLKTIILVTGWTTNYNTTENTAMDTIAEAYNCRGDHNVIVIDTAEFLDTLYSWSAFNTKDIGELLAKGLVKLVKEYPLENIHLIGHSLGAHICGAAGRHFTEIHEKLIKRITGLDPANPCFNEGAQLSNLARGDAEFVDIIHSNNGALGKRDPLGDADFYPDGLDPLPPGCYTIICAHARAWELYAETVYPGNENGLMGVKCTSLTALNTGYCKGRPYPMGFNCPFNLKGNFFLKTNGQSPFGINNKIKSDIQCKQ